MVAEDTENQITHELQRRGYRGVRVHLVARPSIWRGRFDSSPIEEGRADRERSRSAWSSSGACCGA